MYMATWPGFQRMSPGSACESGTLVPALICASLWCGIRIPACA